MPSRPGDLAVAHYRKMNEQGSMQPAQFRASPRRQDMIYLVGGAPRSGKSVLGQQVAAHLNIGWVATDVLRSLLRAEGDEEWDATPKAITNTADWLFPAPQALRMGH